MITLQKMRTLAALSLLLLSVWAAEATVYLRDHSGEHLAAGAAAQQLTAQGLASTVATLAGGSSVLTINTDAADQVGWSAHSGVL